MSSQFVDRHGKKKSSWFHDRHGFMIVMEEILNLIVMEKKDQVLWYLKEFLIIIIIITIVRDSHVSEG